MTEHQQDAERHVAQNQQDAEPDVAPQKGDTASSLSTRERFAQEPSVLDEASWCREASERGLARAYAATPPQHIAEWVGFALVSLLPLSVVLVAPAVAREPTQRVLTRARELR